MIEERGQKNEARMKNTELSRWRDETEKELRVPSNNQLFSKHISSRKPREQQIGENGADPTIREQIGSLCQIQHENGKSWEVYSE